jgi:multisubunit Na+/H+ antiporter MnhB subunit
MHFKTFHLYLFISILFAVAAVINIVSSGTVDFSAFINLTAAILLGIFAFYKSTQLPKIK